MNQKRKRQKKGSPAGKNPAAARQSRGDSNIQALLAKAAAVRHRGGLGEAKTLCRQALVLHPDHPDALHFLGALAAEQGDPQKGLDLVQKALKQAPANVHAHLTLAAILKDQRRLDEAMDVLRKAAAINPRHRETHMQMTLVARDLDRLEDAVAAYRSLLEIDPTDDWARVNLGFNLHEAGQFEEAKALYRQTLELNPLNGEAFRHLSDLKTFSAGDEDIACMEKTLSHAKLPVEQAMHLCFALCKAHEDLGDSEQAFTYLERANTLKRRSFGYDIRRDEGWVDRMIALFTPEFIACHDGKGHGGPEPIFILGMPRSGTSLVEQTLASHSQVFGGGELKDFRALIPGLAGADGDFAATMAADGVLESAGRAYVDSVQQRAPDSPRITDKMPANSLFAGFIALTLPDARIIHCVRDPVDTCLSCFRKYFAEGNEFAYDMRELGRYYRLYSRLMDHWRRVLPGRLHDVRYEDVIADHERETRRLLGFCRLPWEDACLAFHKTKRTVRTLSAAQVRQPIYASAIKRWKRYEHRLGPMLEALGPLVPR